MGTALLALCLATSALFAQAESVLILHTNDLHGYIQSTNQEAGLARIAAYVRQVRQTREDVLLLDAGDCISGTPLSALSEGEAVFEVMSAVGYDATVLGNHEFDHGWNKIETFLQIASFPILSANAYALDGERIGDAQYLIKEIAGVRVGVIGVSHRDTAELTVRNGNEGIVFVDEVEVLSDIVPQVRARSDLVVVLSHAGIERDIDIARYVHDVDLIVGGHSHILAEGPLWVGTTCIRRFA